MKLIIFVIFVIVVIFNLMQFITSKWEGIKVLNEVYYKLENKGKAEYMLRGLLIGLSTLQMASSIIITIAGLFYFYIYK